MRAIILASNETHGLHPLTERFPTAMLPVLNRPVMVGVIEQLARQGVKDVVVSLFNLPGSVEAYFGTGQRWNLSLEYVLLREPMGTAGALKWAENLLTETFIVLPADQVFELNLSALLAWHQSQQSLATLVVHPRGTGSEVNLSSTGKILQGNDGVNTFRSTGIFLFEPSALQEIPPRTVWDISTDLIPALLRQNLPVNGYQLPDFWHPIQNFQDFQASHWNYLQHIETRSLEEGLSVRADVLLRARPVARGIWVGRNTMVHPAARLSPPVFIGENSFVGRDVELGPEAMIGSNVLVDDGATIAYSTVLDHTYVGQLVNVRQSIATAGLLIDSKTGQSLPIVDQFLLGEIRSFESESFLQRLPDAFIALCLLVGLSPFLLLFASMSLVSTGRIYTHTLQLGAETGPNSLDSLQGALKRFHTIHFSTQRADGRLSGVGRWMIRWEFHRLPELWNVLIGDLRLIGVKSLSLDDAGKINEKWQQKRNEYSPGFSGLWYLQSVSENSLDEILITDAYYVATRNWREDIRIFWKTPAAWWKRVSKSRT